MKKMMKTMMKTMLCMLLAVALLSGCMRVKETFTVGADGSVKFYTEVLYEKQKLYDAFFEMAEETGESISEQEINDLLKQQGYELITKDGTEYYRMSAFDESPSVSSMKEFYQSMLLPKAETEDYISLTETSLEATITTDIQKEMDAIFGDKIFDAEYMMQGDDAKAYEMLQKYMKDSEYIFSYTFATPVVKVSEGAVLSEDKKTVSFTIPMTENKAAAKIYAYCENDIALDGVKSGIIYGKTVTYTIPEGVQAALNGSAVEGTVSSEKTGTYELCLKAADGTQKTLYYEVDKEGPVLQKIKNNGIYNSKKVIMLSDTSGIDQVTVDGKSVFDSLELDIDGMDAITDFKYSYKLGSLKEGKHTLTAADKLSNKSSITFCIDKTAPKVTGVKNNKTYKKPVTVKVTDKNGVKSVTLNGKKIKSGKKVSKKGSYKLVAKDVAGNQKIVMFKIKK